MSSEPQSQLPGYSLDEDPQDDPLPALLSEPERADSPVLISGASRAGDAVSSAAAAVSSSSPIIPTQPTPTPPRQEGDSTAHTPPLPERPVVDEFTDPKIAGLHAIFPDYDAALLYSVVDSVGGDEDQAVDALLAMSDPDHVPTHHVATPEQPSVAEQTQLDEEFARQLLLEDEQQYARDQIALRQQEQIRHFPYAPRTQAPAPPQGNRGDGFRGDDDVQQEPPQPQPQQRDTMADMQEQFTKLAETGKRTFSSLVSKVKAKVQELDQTR
ncbi:hypothetical protein BJV74DRAFT_88590 [Russula compacta]|nr:hypothetical protein BJV74DRAFT_88590 [Russula compacta]